MVLTILLICGFALALFGLLFLALVRRSRTDAVDPLEWLESFSAATYEPMSRLLDESDYTFLAAQPGFETSIARRLRRSRIEIFHSYLGAMIRDFERLMKVGRVIAVFAREDQTRFAEGWSSLRWRFYSSVIAIEARVALHWMGLGTVDTRGLLASLQVLETRAQQLIPAA